MKAPKAPKGESILFHSNTYENATFSSVLHTGLEKKRHFVTRGILPLLVHLSLSAHLPICNFRSYSACARLPENKKQK